jgi:dienelactone hydrolase
VVRIVYDRNDRVAGLFFVTPPPAPLWTPPPYAAQSTFEERTVSVGTNPELPGEITLPRGAANVPAVVLVHGSGPQDADETVGQIKVFKDIAWGLASRGIAVLRYDKRTYVEPRGVVTVKEEVVDGAVAAIERLGATPGIDPKRILVLGHSQGGYLAPRIARDNPRVAGLVILAGNTRPLEEVALDQVRYLASLSSDAPDLSRETEALRFKAAVEDPGLTPDSRLPELAGGVTGAYFLDLRSYHPAEVAAKLACPIFIARGERDYHVTQADFDGWRHELSTSPNVTWKQYPPLNHMFVAGSGPATPTEYERPGHVDAALIDDLVAWIASVPARG